MKEIQLIFLWTPAFAGVTEIIDNVIPAKAGFRYQLQS